MNLLQSISITLPNHDNTFDHKLASILQPFIEYEGNSLTFTKSNPSFLPTISLRFDAISEPQAQFHLDSQTITVPITNQTGQDRSPKLPYTPILIDDFLQRIKGWSLTHLDHVGFNLPWFDGVHPEIVKFRKQLAPVSAYYRFPTGEEWDFILPATEAEITSNTIDLSKERRPKFEIVSFDMTSTPLTQIDCAADQSFETIKRTFPEGIVEEDIQKVWVAIQNPYGIDVFFVVGEQKSGDWGEFFEGWRLQNA